MSQQLRRDPAWVRAIDVVTSGAGYLAGAAVIVLTVLITNEVILRKLGLATPFTFDVAIILTLFVALVGACDAVRGSGSSAMAMEFVVVRLPARAQRLCHAITSIVGLVFAAVLVWTSTQSVLDAFASQRMTQGMLRIPMGYVLALLPLGGALLFLAELPAIYRSLAGPEPPAVAFEGHLGPVEAVAAPVIADDAVGS